MIEVTDFDYNGRGIGRLNEKIVFIENALPNEIVDINIVKDKKKYIEANVSSYIKKSSKRIEPKCPYYNECGGCNLMHISYDDQLKFKENMIRNIVKKVLGYYIKINNIVKCDNNFNYRNKVTFQVNKSIGFYKKNSYELVSLDKCIIANEKINEIIPYLKELDLNKITKIVVKTNGQNVMVIIYTDFKDLDIELLKNKCDSIYIKEKDKYILEYGDNFLSESLGDYKYIISPDSFFQVNPNVAEKLYDKIKELVGNNQNIIDLYCGTGSIGIYISQSNKVLGIEINKDAYRDCLKNKELNNLNNIDFLCGDSGKKLDSIDFKANTIIVDPPRNGLNNETILNLIKSNPEKIIYVSCNPITLVRDLKLLNEHYDICEITPFDMFPNTHHVESVCVLERK